MPKIGSLCLRSSEKLRKNINFLIKSCFHTSGLPHVKTSHLLFFIFIINIPIYISYVHARNQACIVYIKKVMVQNIIYFMKNLELYFFTSCQTCQSQGLFFNNSASIYQNVLICLKLDQNLIKNLKYQQKYKIITSNLSQI